MAAELEGRVKNVRWSNKKVCMLELVFFLSQVIETLKLNLEDSAR